MTSVIDAHIYEVVKGPDLKIVAFECSECEGRGPTEGSIEHDDWCIVGEATALQMKLEAAENENQGLSDACVRLRDKMKDAGVGSMALMVGGPEYVVEAATAYFGRLDKRKDGYMHKLDPEEVATIIEKYETGNITQVRLAQYYGVSQAAISMIVRKKRRGKTNANSDK